MRILLVDGNHLASRVRHAQKSLRTSDGRRSGVVYGILQNLQFVKRRLTLNSDQIFFIWDGGRSTFRKKLLPEYKTRPDPEDVQELEEYKGQLDALYRNLNSFGIRGQLRISGVEADDLISAMAHTVHGMGDTPVVYSSDRDLHQLADVALIFDPVKEVLTKDDILTLHEVSEIKQIPLSKAIQGDKSDTIHGVGGIGKVFAARVLPFVSNYFGILDRPDPEPDESTANLVQKVKDRAEIVRRNLELITLPKDFDSVRDLHMGGLEEITSALAHKPAVDYMGMKKFLTHWECNSLLDNISSF